MKWISVEDKLPDNNQLVLVLYEKGYFGYYSVAHFLYYETLRNNPYPNECVDVEKNPYYFCSQEVKQPLNNVSHWMTLPQPPL